MILSNGGCQSKCIPIDVPNAAILSRQKTLRRNALSADAGSWYMLRENAERKKTARAGIVLRAAAAAHVTDKPR